MEKRKAETQRDQVLALLKSRGTEGISAIELDRKFGIYRAAARVMELRELGWRIKTIKSPNKTALYILPPTTREVDLGNGFLQPEVW